MSKVEAFFENECRKLQHTFVISIVCSHVFIMLLYVMLFPPICFQQNYDRHKNKNCFLVCLVSGFCPFHPLNCLIFEKELHSVLWLIYC